MAPSVVPHFCPTVALTWNRWLIIAADRARTARQSADPQNLRTIAHRAMARASLDLELSWSNTAFASEI
jgi:hypothetical protein